jgi:hypothetical protein
VRSCGGIKNANSAALFGKQKRTLGLSFYSSGFNLYFAATYLSTPLSLCTIRTHNHLVQLNAPTPRATLYCCGAPIKFSPAPPSSVTTYARTRCEGRRRWRRSHNQCLSRSIELDTQAGILCNQNQDSATKRRQLSAKQLRMACGGLPVRGSLHQ